MILSLCDYTGTWAQPYVDAGYDVRQVDIQHGEDIRLLEYPGEVHGIIAQPPCTHSRGPVLDGGQGREKKLSSKASSWSMRACASSRCAILRGGSWRTLWVAFLTGWGRGR